MGIFKMLGANKNDVKVAQATYKTEKLKQKNEEKSDKNKAKQNLVDEAKKICRYANNNFERLSSASADLLNKTKALSKSISNSENSKLSHDEKKKLRSNKKQLEEDINYLYLIKDYFLFLTKVTNDIALYDSQYKFVVKFSPYFDGIKVLKQDDEGDNEKNNDEDDSLLGQLNDLKNELRNTFVSSENQSEFYFQDFLYKYQDEIDDQVIPNIDSAMKEFKSSYAKSGMSAKADENEHPTTSSLPTENQEIRQEAPTQNEIECPNCHNKIRKDSKFCPECGAKIEAQSQHRFCLECGSPLEPGSKFCPNCGHKVE